MKRPYGMMVVAPVALILGLSLCSTGCGLRVPRHYPPQTEFQRPAAALKGAFPNLFLADVAVHERDDVAKQTLCGEPDPPEGFAGSDPQGRLPLGICVPSARDGMFDTDISLEQWIVHEMFHLNNRRTGQSDSYIDAAFPTDYPLIQWLMADPYHRTFAREEAFTNLIMFADPTRTERQRSAVRTGTDVIGASAPPLDEVRAVLRVIPHLRNRNRVSRVRD